MSRGSWRTTALGTRADAVDKVDKILARNGMTMDYLLDQAQEQKAGELAQAYVRGEPSAINLIQQASSRGRMSIDALVAEGLQGQGLEYIERIDHLTNHRRESP